MSKYKSDNKRIAKNTLLLYFRMLILMAVNLYTSRIVLKTLGVDDYGIYNVMGGVVAMFTILSQSLSKSISRFITFELGRENSKKLNEIFSTSINIQFIMAAIIIAIGELGGLWFINYKMNVDPERMFAANMVLQFSLFNFGVNLVSVPYNAAIVAHERMGAFAYISITEAALKLGAIYVLGLLSFDKLIGWAACQSAVALLIRYIYARYCTTHFKETKYRFLFKKKILKEMFGFATWNFIGSVGGVLRSQGVNMLLNVSFGTAVNAARGLAEQVNNAIAGFANNFMTAVNPQITKLYAQDKVRESFMLSMASCRLSFFMILALSLPIAAHTEYILGIWLPAVPDALPNFVRLTLLLSLLESISIPLITVQLATGRIKKYQIVVGGLHLLNFPLSWLALHCGYGADTTYWIAIFLSEVCLIARLIMLKQIAPSISIKDFLKDVVLKTTIVLAVATAPVFGLSMLAIHPIIQIILAFIISIVAILCLGLHKQELVFLKSRISRK